MRQNLLKTIALGLLTLCSSQAWADDVVEVLAATQDGWYRMDNASVTYDIAASNHIELKRYTDGETVKDFYGLLAFEVPPRHSASCSVTRQRALNQCTMHNAQ